MGPKNAVTYDGRRAREDNQRTTDETKNVKPTPFWAMITLRLIAFFCVALPLVL